MSTYSEVQERINSDYLNRTNFSAETKRALLASIRHFEYSRWTFNETATALTTSSSQSYVSLPSNFLVLDDLRITLNGENLPLNRRDPQTIRDWNTGMDYGQPTDYAIYNNRLELFVIPDSAYSLPVYYIKKLDVLSSDADTNEWIQGGMEDVVVYHAAKLMWANVLRNNTEAMKFAALEKEALTVMTSHLEQMQIRRLKPTPF